MQVITIHGNLVADAQLRTRKDANNSSQSEFISFKVACNSVAGEVKETTYYDVTYRKTGIFEYLKKGQPVVVSGLLRATASVKENGQAYINMNIYNTSIVELAGKRQLND